MMCSMYYTDFWCGSALIPGVKLDFCSLVGRVDEQCSLQTFYGTITSLYIKNMTEHLVVNRFEDIFYANAQKIQYSMFESRIVYFRIKWMLCKVGIIQLWKFLHDLDTHPISVWTWAQGVLGEKLHCWLVYLKKYKKA